MSRWWQRPVPARPAAAILFMAAITTAGCASPAPDTPTARNETDGPPPAGTAPVAGSSGPGPSASAWLIATIQQPAPVVDSPTLPPNFQCHPCRPLHLAENDLLGVGATPGGLIAAGVRHLPRQPPPSPRPTGRAGRSCPASRASKARRLSRSHRTAGERSLWGTITTARPRGHPMAPRPGRRLRGRAPCWSPMPRAEWRR